MVGDPMARQRDGEPIPHEGVLILSGPWRGRVGVLEFPKPTDPPWPQLVRVNIEADGGSVSVPVDYAALRILAQPLEEARRLIVQGVGPATKARA
jgi:hypothetical protein